MVKAWNPSLILSPCACPHCTILASGSANRQRGEEGGKMEEVNAFVLEASLGWMIDRLGYFKWLRKSHTRDHWA